MVDLQKLKQSFENLISVLKIAINKQQQFVTRMEKAEAELKEIGKKIKKLEGTIDFLKKEAFDKEKGLRWWQP